MAACDEPICPPTAQPLVSLSSMAAATGKFFCSCVARALCSLRTFGASAPGTRARTLKSVRMKFPDSLRPGPFLGSDGSASASTRMARTSLKRVLALNVNQSVSGFVPVTAIDPSSCLESVAPPFDLRFDTSSTVHEAEPSDPASPDFSHAASRPGNSSCSNRLTASTSG
jgi:hypothetical protein